MKQRKMIILAGVLLCTGLLLVLLFISLRQGEGDVPHEDVSAKPVQQEREGISDLTKNSEDRRGYSAGSEAKGLDIPDAPQPSPDLAGTTSGAGIWDSAQTLSEIFKQSADRYDWSPEVRHANQVQWEPSCRSVDRTPKPGVTMEDLNRLDPRAVMERNLREICGFIVDETALTTLDNMLEERQIVDAAVKADLDNLRQHASFGDSESSLELAAELLARALESRDEHFITSIINLLAFNELLNPFIVDGEANYKVVYMNVTREVSATLLCRRIGGCRGEENPFVLRQCVTGGRERGAFCVRSSSLEEAVYQTLTPVEYQAYLSFVDQIEALIRKHR